MVIKIKRNQPVTSSKEDQFFDIAVPHPWRALSDEQLLFFFRQLSRDLPMEEILTLCLFRWADLRVLCRTPDGSFLVMHRHAPKQQACLSVREVQTAICALDYLRHFPPSPVRITHIGNAQAIDKDFTEVPFSTFLSCDNYYQGFLHTKNDALLKDLAALLYPNVKRKHLTKPYLYGCFYWFASLKWYFSGMFPHFLQPMPSEPTNLLGSSPNIGEILRTAMNAQIRALTGGDITKEQAVLSMDTWRALTELDAKAKEAEDLRRQSK